MISNLTCSFLYLMRHAQAHSFRFGQDDIERPLSTQGVHEACAIGAKFPLFPKAPDVALVSSATRTQQTFANLCLQSAPPKLDSDELYHGDENAYLSLLRCQKASSVLLIGHNPTVSQFMQLLVGSKTIDAPAFFPTAGLAVIAFSTSFQNLEIKSGELMHFFTPA